MASFIDNLRSAFDNYSRDVERSKEIERLKGKLRGNDVALAAKEPLRAMVDAAGAGAIGTGLAAGGPIGALGALSGGTLLTAEAIASAQSKNALVKERAELQNELQQAYTRQWTDYKNSQIKKITGKSVGDLARQGKMVDDDGNIIDIDYDYYATVPRQTLSRVFGDGSAAVLDVIHNRNK